MVIYQIIFFGGDLMVFGGGGIEGVCRRQQSIRRVLWNIYCRLTTNEGGGWGKGGIRILQSFIGGNTYFISIHTTAYQRHKSCEFSFDSNKET